MNLTERILRKIAGPYIHRRIQEAVAETDRGWRSLSQRQTDLPAAERRQNILDSIEAWQKNPLAFRITELTIDYVLGQSLSVQAWPSNVDTFLRRWWDHPLNRMENRLRTMMREISLTGDLFTTYYTNPYDGMTYVRPIPTLDVTDILTADNDHEQEIGYRLAATSEHTEETTLGSGDVSHFTLSTITGTNHGQGDLWPVLPWLRRYKDWLTDRVIINKYKGAYLWDVTLDDADASTIALKKSELSTPPTAGSVIVHNQHEIWKATQPTISASDSEADGRALRMMISTGTGTPLHWLGEGTQYNRAVGELMGEPATRRLEHRQQIAKHILTSIIDQVIARARANGALPASRRAYKLTLTFPDLTTNDILAQAQALNAAAQAIEKIDLLKLMDNPKYKAWLEHYGQMLPTVGDTSNIADPDTDTDQPAASPTSPTSPIGDKTP